MGVVYEAVRESLRSNVALKVMHPQFRDREKYLRRFRTEARSAARLHHTNIVSVFDYGVHDGVCYYAMQYIAGHSLDKILADVRQLRQEKEVSPAVETATMPSGEEGPSRLRPKVRSTPARRRDDGRLEARGVARAADRRVVPRPDVPELPRRRDDRPRRRRAWRSRTWTRSTAGPSAGPGNGQRAGERRRAGRGGRGLPAHRAAAARAGAGSDDDEIAPRSSRVPPGRRAGSRATADPDSGGAALSHRRSPARPAPSSARARRATIARSPGWAPRSPTPWPMPTSGACCTATSSRRT